MLVGVLSACASVCRVHTQRLEKKGRVADALELELETAVSRHLGARN